MVTLICDAGERYLQTYHNEAWMARQHVDLAPWRRQLAEFAETGAWTSRVRHARHLDRSGQPDTRSDP